MEETKHLNNIHNMTRGQRIKALAVMIDNDTRSLAMELEAKLLDAHNAAQELVALKPSHPGVAEAARFATIQLASLHELLGCANQRNNLNG